MSGSAWRAASRGLPAGAQPKRSACLGVLRPAASSPSTKGGWIMLVCDSWPRATAVSPATLRSHARVSFPTTLGQDCGGPGPSFCGGNDRNGGDREQISRALSLRKRKKLGRCCQPTPGTEHEDSAEASSVDRLVQSPGAHALSHLPVPWQNPWVFLRPTDIRTDRTEHIVSPTSRAVFVRDACLPALALETQRVHEYRRSSFIRQVELSWSRDSSIIPDRLSQARGAYPIVDQERNRRTGCPTGTACRLLSAGDDDGWPGQTTLTMWATGNHQGTPQ